MKAPSSCWSRASIAGATRYSDIYDSVVHQFPNICSPTGFKKCPFFEKDFSSFFSGGAPSLSPNTTGGLRIPDGFFRIFPGGMRNNPQCQ